MKLWRRLVHWWRFDRHAALLADEIEDHRARIQADLEAAGASRADAAAQSRRVMGNITLAREDAREIWLTGWIDRLVRDAKYGLRGLRREPTFTLTAMLTLVLGVTTITTVFSIVDAEVWKPLPYPRPDRLVAIHSRAPFTNSSTDAIAGADLLEWRQGAASLTGIAAEGPTTRRVLYLQHAESVRITEVTPNFFSTLGCPAVAGRTFVDADASGTGSAVITDRAFRRLFNTEPSTIAERSAPVMLDGDAIAIVGVIRADALLCDGADLFVVMNERAPVFLDRKAPVLYGGIGRLADGVDPEVARAQVQAVADRMAADGTTDRVNHIIVVEDLRVFSTGYNSRPLYFFLGASGLVLLLSAINVAALLVGRAFRRTREFALRGALGGGQRALARQLLVEGLLLALPAGAVSILLSGWAVRIFTSALPADALVRGTAIPIDLRVAAFALLVTTATTLVFVLMPLHVTRRVDLSMALGLGSRTGRNAGEGRARAVLLVAQLALTVILTANAAMFLKSFAALTRVPLGFDPENAIAMRASLSGPRYATPDSIREYAGRLLREVSAAPGLERAAIGSSSPLGSGPLVDVAVADRPAPPPDRIQRAILRAVTPGYFNTLRIPMIRGRDFTAGDVDGAPRVAVVNETLARLWADGEDPDGRAIEILPSTRASWARRAGRLTVVGVVANVKDVALNEMSFPGVYVPFAQMPAPAFEVIARALVPPAGLTETLRTRAADIDRATPVTSVTTFEQRLDGALRGERFTVLLISTFAALALLLSAVGVYGAVAYAVQSRTREIGIQLSLGARPSRLMGATLWSAARLACAGAAAGLAGTLLLAALIGNALYSVPGSHRGLLYGVTTTEPLILASAVAGLLVTAVAAAAVPARRVVRIDPVEALRAE